MENWVAVQKKSNREIFSELDVLLRAIDRFFSFGVLPHSGENTADRNYFDELTAIRDTILRIISLLEIIIPESSRNAYWFQKFAQSKFLTDKKKDLLREELFRQDTPEKSLFLLYDTFINLRGIITDILKANPIPYLTFMNVGHIIGRELRENLYFNPFKKELNPEYDSIENHRLSGLVRGIREKEIRKHVSLVFLSLFRFIRYLRYADTSSRHGSLNSSLVIILLLRSELEQFTHYLGTAEVSVQDSRLSEVFRALSYQFSMEMRRVFLQELRNAFRNKSLQHLKGRIENSNGILKNLAEQSIVQLSQHFDPSVRGEEIFSFFITRREQSVKLREDMVVLQKVFSLLEQASSREERLRIFDSLRRYMHYFQNFTFKLLRHDDYEEFAVFFEKVLAISRDMIKGKSETMLFDRIRQFSIFVGTCLSQIANRTELFHEPLDNERVGESLNHFLQ